MLLRLETKFMVIRNLHYVAKIWTSGERKGSIITQNSDLS